MRAPNASLPLSLQCSDTKHTPLPKLEQQFRRSQPRGAEQVLTELPQLKESYARAPFAHACAVCAIAVNLTPQTRLCSSWVR